MAENSSTKALTQRQRTWLEHLNACRTQGESLKTYAQAHNLSVSALYAAKSELVRRGVWQQEGAAKVRSAKFVPVRVAPSASVFRIVLPNGIIVEVPERADAQCCGELLRAVKAVS
jgi:hypothetical protein